MRQAIIDASLLPLEDWRSSMKIKTFSEYWTHPGDPIAYWRHASMKCAEVLVPDSVSTDFIMGAYVSCEASRDQIASDAPGLPAEINRRLFFR